MNDDSGDHHVFATRQHSSDARSPCSGLKCHACATSSARASFLWWNEPPRSDVSVRAAVHTLRGGFGPCLFQFFQFSPKGDLDPPETGGSFTAFSSGLPVTSFVKIRVKIISGPREDP